MHVLSDSASVFIDALTCLTLHYVCRLWCRPRRPDDEKGPTYIGVMSVVPRMTSPNDAKPMFASFADTVTSINEQLTSQPLSGKTGHHSRVQSRYRFGTTCSFKRAWMLLALYEHAPRQQEFHKTWMQVYHQHRP